MRWFILIIYANNVKGVSITPLAKDTIKDKNNNNVVPVLLRVQSESTRHRSNLERALKEARFRVAYHWPQDMIDNVKEIRKQMVGYLDNDITIQNQLMIRPSSTGQALVISHRAGFNTKWKYVTTVRTPAPKHLLELTGLPQPAHSKFFDLTKKAPEPTGSQGGTPPPSPTR